MIVVVIGSQAKPVKDNHGHASHQQTGHDKGNYQSRPQQGHNNSRQYDNRVSMQDHRSSDKHRQQTQHSTRSQHTNSNYYGNSAGQRQNNSDSLGSVQGNNPHPQSVHQNYGMGNARHTPNRGDPKSGDYPTDGRKSSNYGNQRGSNSYNDRHRGGNSSSSYVSDQYSSNNYRSGNSSTSVQRGDTYFGGRNKGGNYSAEPHRPESSDHSYDRRGGSSYDNRRDGNHSRGQHSERNSTIQKSGEPSKVKYSGTNNVVPDDEQGMSRKMSGSQHGANSSTATSQIAKSTHNHSTTDSQKSETPRPAAKSSTGQQKAEATKHSTQNSGGYTGKMCSDDVRVTSSQPKTQGNIQVQSLFTLQADPLNAITFPESSFPVRFCERTTVNKASAVILKRTHEIYYSKVVLSQNT